ncbi:hypothetical protein GON03_13180 [Nocardioides sp. MAH-18]|uniref:Septum formation-related domain-containing protein n=1 Tax=Nocardioides agri TaxID=2682843 RepID=A0A6L6XU04_9ACTN|nr:MULTISPECIES: septum formation family protein [unclassified Nocardioides]MBA2955286.1 septum formation family protein [Nocardioides sp. CGMCC 1.13656]MVQ50137.1 hypothetical protein [Nocardioides sp. MAH-18]
MNGSDLRQLALRASSMPDRTPDRLVELHERVAVVRRRRRVTVLVASAAAIILVVAMSLVLVAVGSGDRTPDPAPPPEPNADVSRPAVGTCWLVPPASSGSPDDQDYWRDDSPQVPCSEEHTTETVAVWTVSEPTVAAATEKAEELCGNQVGAYLGLNSDHWIPFGWIAFLPSEDQIADGASWVRCDVVFPSNPAWKSARLTVGSAAGIAGDPPPEFWACVDQPLTVADQPFVPCDRPHRYEQTGRVAVLAGLTEYPDAQRRATAAVQCEAGVPARLAGFEVDAVWPPRSAFVAGGSVTGVCVVHDPAGGPLPPRRP